MSSFTNSAEKNNDAVDNRIVNLSSNYLPTQSKLNLVEDVSVDEIKKNFIAPGVDFSTGPLWVWNDLLTEEQIRATLADLNKQHVNQPFVHPRPGLATPYLSDEWFKLWDAALDEAQKRGMKIWIYDENSYPSGFAGGFVPDAMPESQGSGVDVQFYDELTDKNGVWSVGDSILYVIEQFADGTRDRTQEVLIAKETGKLPPAKTSSDSRWIVVRKRLAGSSQWYGGKTYVNLLTSGVLEKFLTFTHEAYRARYADKFGNLIPGSFTDEPQVASAGAFSWTDDFAEEFRNRNKYDIVPHLGSLVDHIGDWKKIRYDYYKTVLQLFVERWHKPYAEYCERVGLEYTGHDWEHEWPNAHHVPDNMATAFWRQRPAIDLLMNQFSRNMHSQFGNVRAVRELSSVVHQAGRRRSLCETYGAGGYDICFADLKRLGDWSFALGVNTMDEHLSYISIRGARKHDHPQTFSYHSPWFEQYSKLEDYWTRLSYILSCGKLTSERFLLIEPTSTEWLYQANDNGDPAQKDQVGVEFTNLLNKLEEEQIDYDLGSEDIIARIGSVNHNELCVGAAHYKTVVLPPRLENLDENTVRLFETFIRNGGTLISLNANFSLVSGRAILDLNDSQKELKNACQIIKSSKVCSFDDLVKETRKTQPIVLRPSSNAENLFHLTRETKDSLILFVCNIDMEESARGKIALNDPWKNSNVEVFDPETGVVKSCSNMNDLILEPCESITIVFSKSGTPNTLTGENLEPQTIYSQDLITQNTLSSIQALDDNVLVLDYMTLKLQDETFSEDYFYRINGKFWQKKGFPMSPWDNGVQFKDELIKKKFIDESGFELIYRFNKSDAVVDNLRFVVENPSLFDEVYCNNQKVEQIPEAWKFDRSFGVFDISATAKTGSNEIRLVASKSTVFCEIMPAWIVGDFSLEPDMQGFKIVANHALTLNKSSDNLYALTKASSELEGVSWLSSGVGFSDRDDRSPFVSFEFEETTKLDAIRVWNYCETNLSKRGVKNVDVTLVDEDGKQVGEAVACQFKQGDGASQLVELPEMKILTNWKFVLTIKSNWNGISYPLSADYIASTEPRSDSAFVGMAEIQFLRKDESGKFVKIPKTPKVAASSELVFRSHNRRAQFLTDSSGLYVQESGWAAQGRPFYAGKVDYTFSVPLDIISQDRPVHFKLSRWRGAVAAILVDGKQVGAIGWKGDEVDLTDAVRAVNSQNQNSLTLTIRVYGTPKNLFGPHHAGKLRGSAWPGSFHSAPQKQPAGSAYDVIEYGLFAE